MKFAFAILFAFASLSAIGSDFRVTLPLVSKHYFCGNNQCIQLNETNLGVGGEYDGYGVISFENSHSRQSFAAYKAFEYGVTSYLGLGIRLGGASGYKEETGMDIVPLVQPYFRLVPMNRFSLNVGIVPVGLVDTKNYNMVITLDSQISF
ncbi:hypothetical protein MD588_20440 [Photobacterium sp. SDRW27]|uniref:hypothetical protein n=1 Tax=Photobacterium obscurum TaxID=2829490 RepID=UPI002243452F|nr:hypothetical protein [Photobacterium obscurum]MCW8331168.1 hypothetical protein [Photobacterium obscurum]